MTGVGVAVYNEQFCYDNEAKYRQFENDNSDFYKEMKPFFDTVNSDKYCNYLIDNNLTTISIETCKTNY
jgi:hypothetical protein